MAKLQGHGDEEGILGDALNVHFGAEGPESWHVRVTKRSEQRSSHSDGAAIGRAVIRRQIRAQARQPWVKSTLLDVANSRQQKYCNILPTPSKFMMSASSDAGRSATGDGARRRKLRAKDRRDAVQAAKDFTTPSSLSERLWSLVRVTVNSLSRDSRREAGDMRSARSAYVAKLQNGVRPKPKNSKR